MVNFSVVSSHVSRSLRDDGWTDTRRQLSPGSDQSVSVGSTDGTDVGVNLDGLNAATGLKY